MISAYQMRRWSMEDLKVFCRAQWCLDKAIRKYRERKEYKKEGGGIRITIKRHPSQTVRREIEKMYGNRGFYVQIETSADQVGVSNLPTTVELTPKPRKRKS